MLVFAVIGSNPRKKYREISFTLLEVPNLSSVICACAQKEQMVIITVKFYRLFDRLFSQIYGNFGTAVRLSEYFRCGYKNDELTIVILLNGR